MKALGRTFVRSVCLSGLAVLLEPGTQALPGEAVEIEACIHFYPLNIRERPGHLEQVGSG